MNTIADLVAEFNGRFGHPRQLHARGELVVESQDALGLGWRIWEEGRGFVDASEGEENVLGIVAREARSVKVRLLGDGTRAQHNKING
jgi:hypothetical protein